MFLTLPLGFLTLVCFKTLENKTDIDKIPGKIFGNNINKLTAGKLFWRTDSWNLNAKTCHDLACKLRPLKKIQHTHSSIFRVSNLPKIYLVNRTTFSELWKVWNFAKYANNSAALVHVTRFVDIAFDLQSRVFHANVTDFVDVWKQNIILTNLLSSPISRFLGSHSV